MLDVVSILIFIFLSNSKFNFKSDDVVFSFLISISSKIVLSLSRPVFNNLIVTRYPSISPVLSLLRISFFDKNKKLELKLIIVCKFVFSLNFVVINSSKLLLLFSKSLLL